MPGRNTIAAAAFTLILAAPALAAQAVISGEMFTELERRVLCDYYKVVSCGTARPVGLPMNGGKPKGGVGSGDKTALLPPGLARRDEQPPGLERQYQRNGKLPPGLAKRRLPDDLARALPRRDGGYERVIAGNDVLLIQTATGEILDILEGVAAGR